MYGRIFESMYDGSMYGAGLAVMALWPYVLIKARQGRVELNPTKLAHTLGCKAEQMERAIEKLCEPDSASSSAKEEGRRLVKEGQFLYRVVNWQDYNRIGNESDRAAYKVRWQRGKRNESMKTDEDKRGQMKTFEDISYVPSPSPIPSEESDRPKESSLKGKLQREESFILSASAEKPPRRKREKRVPVSENPPTIQEFDTYCKGRKITQDDRGYVWNNWQDNGWTRKGRPIYDWKAAVRAWQCGKFLPSQRNTP